MENRGLRQKIFVMKFLPPSLARAASLAACMALFAQMHQISAQTAAPLTTIDYRVTGQSLQITPAALAVPKNIAGSVATAVPGELPAGSFVEAFLRGPSFPARRLVGLPNAPLLLPPLNLVGDYSLDGIRLAAGRRRTLLEGVPASVPVHVFDEVLDLARHLAAADAGGNSGAGHRDRRFKFPRYRVRSGICDRRGDGSCQLSGDCAELSQTTEIIPAAELEARLAEAEQLNQELAGGVVLPPELETAQLNISDPGDQFPGGG